MKERDCFLVVLLVLFLTSMSMSAHGAAGDLDTSFAGRGFTRTGFGFGEDYAYAVAVQVDGKVLVAGTSGMTEYLGGSFSMVRYNADDTLDTSFGDYGKVVTSIGVGNSQANAIWVQSDGKIILAGTSYRNPTNTDLTIVRYNPDGSLDSTFGTNGIVTTDVGVYDTASGLVLPGDGKILVVGSIGNGFGTHSDIVVARYLTNGVLDTTFDGDGLAIKSMAASIDASAMTLQPDGKILVAGTTSFHMAVFRFLTNGLPDTTFDGDGMANITIGSDSRATAIAMQLGDGSLQRPDKILVAGSSTTNSSTFSFAVARLNLDGTLDTSFDGDGKVTTRVGNYFESASSILVEQSGLNASRIIVGGYSSEPVTQSFRRDFTVVKYFLNGALDTAFDGDGKAITQIGATGDSEIGAMAFQNGRILAVGYARRGPGNDDFAMVRYNAANGSLDSTFDGDGIKLQDIAERDAKAEDVALQPDGKIVVVGSAYNGERNVAAIARYNSDGTLDTSFGTVGKILPAVSTNGSGANAVAIQPDGKILVAGYANLGANNDFMVLRFLTNGMPDNSFDGDGVAITPIGPGDDVATSLALQADGKIVVAGYSHNGGNNDFAVVRYNTNGTLDATFDGDGKAVTAIASGDDQANDVKIQADGKIVVAGYGTLANVQYALVRYNTNGALDTSFGSFGRVATSFGDVAQGMGMAIQPNGRIVVVGGAVFGGTEIDMTVARYLPNGTLDNSFDGDGKVTTPIGLGQDVAFAVAVQPDGKLLVAGAGAIGADYEFATVRYFPDGSLDSAYGNGGRAVHDISTGLNDIARGMVLDETGRAVIAGEANGKFGVMRLLGDPVLKILSVTRLPNGHALLQGTGVPNGNHTVQSSTTLNAGSFLPIGSVTADALGNWQYDDAGAAGMARRFYRLSVP